MTSYSCELTFLWFPRVVRSPYTAFLMGRRYWFSQIYFLSPSPIHNSFIFLPWSYFGFLNSGLRVLVSLESFGGGCDFSSSLPCCLPDAVPSRARLLGVRIRRFDGNRWCSNVPKLNSSPLFTNSTCQPLVNRVETLSSCPCASFSAFFIPPAIVPPFRPTADLSLSPPFGGLLRGLISVFLPFPPFSGTPYCVFRPVAPPIAF